MPYRRRTFLATVSTSALSLTCPAITVAENIEPTWPEPNSGEGLIEYIIRTCGKWDDDRYKQLLGCANEFKEGDEILGIAAKSADERALARELLSHTRLADIDKQAPLQDQQYGAIQAAVNAAQHEQTGGWTMLELKQYLLSQDEFNIHKIASGLSSDVIACVVKLMSNDELTQVGAKIFNPLPDSNIGAKGYLGARIQPNSPTDNVDDIRWQVLDAWSYAVGDVLLGTNPVSSEVDSVAAVESALQELLQTFDLEKVLPHCVLSHIDVQAQVEQKHPGRTALWFQSIAGSDAANATFDVTLQKLLHYASTKRGPYGLYFETGQGADFTNGHGNGFDMVIHESRKYGLARLLSQKFAAANSIQGRPWTHVNDVAGFIGPEVFRSRAQLVRCCLEDIVMGKLHGLCIGLDVCSTLHMDVSLDDLDWCLEQVIAACPAYLMALPTKIDPMLGYLTTGYQDHVRLRQKFGCKVNNRMWEFFKSLGVIDNAGQPTEHFGDPLWVYLKYRRHQGDNRHDEQILDEGRQQMAAVRRRGVFLASGHGQNSAELQPQLAREIKTIYDDAKSSIWAELTPGFKQSRSGSAFVKTLSRNREDYILHPTSGEQLGPSGVDTLEQLKRTYAGQFNVQFVISDGLNALAITDLAQLEPFISKLVDRLKAEGLKPAPTNIIVDSGRVRAGYKIAEQLFGELSGLRGLIHIIGERPGSGHRTFSAYMTCPSGEIWKSGKVDHDKTSVVAGIANTAFPPVRAADEAAKIFLRMWQG
ncbi:MAG: ethanolamine ammonia-lyase subunit EutB [Pirellulales bacterium]